MRNLSANKSFFVFANADFRAIIKFQIKEGVNRNSLPKCIGLFTEVSVKQTLESSAVTSLVASHLMNGVMDRVKIQLLDVAGIIG